MTAIILMAGYCSFAQTATTTPAPKQTATAKPKHVQNAAAYACPKCFAITKGAGKCEKDGTDKIQLGTYYCPACMKGTGTKAGKCPTCGKATVQMTRKYCAQQLAKLSPKTKDAMKM